jgi:hypothetical protein
MNLLLCAYNHMQVDSHTLLKWGAGREIYEGIFLEKTEHVQNDGLTYRQKVKRYVLN